MPRTQCAGPPAMTKPMHRGLTGKTLALRFPHLVQPPRSNQAERSRGLSTNCSPPPSWGRGRSWGCNGPCAPHPLPWLLPFQSQGSSPHVTGGPTQAESLRIRRSPEPGGAVLALCAPPGDSGDRYPRGSPLESPGHTPPLPHLSCLTWAPSEQRGGPAWGSHGCYDAPEGALCY